MAAAYQTYKTIQEAREARDTMQGWTTALVKMYLPDNPNADHHGNAWVIRCGQGQYLRTTGYVD